MRVEEEPSQQSLITVPARDLGPPLRPSRSLARIAGARIVWSRPKKTGVVCRVGSERRSANSRPAPNLARPSLKIFGPGGALRPVSAWLSLFRMSQNKTPCTEQLMVHLTPELRDRIEIIAREEGRSLSSTVRRILEHSTADHANDAVAA